MKRCRGAVSASSFGVPITVLDATHGDGLEPVCSPGRDGSKSGRLGSARESAGDRPAVAKKQEVSPGYLCPARARSRAGKAVAPARYLAARFKETTVP